MATQANSYDGFEAAVEAGASASRNTRRERADAFRPRALPNEEIYFYRKTIDNSRVVRQADPEARARCWRRVVLMTAGTLGLAAFLWPNLYGMLAGYQIEALKQQQERLTAERASLEVEEARLMSPARLQDLAPTLEFSDPDPAQVVFLNSKPDGSLALNTKSK